jgi:hypothetical protein
MFMDSRDPRLREIWRQSEIPVVFMQEKSKPLLFRLTLTDEDFNWIRGERRRGPLWNDQYNCWETPVAWFDDLIQRGLKKFGKVYVVQAYKEQQKCAPACWGAKGFHCECSCMGVNHGSGHPGGNWREVSDTFAFNWGERQYACRLIKASCVGTS